MTGFALSIFLITAIVGVVGGRLMARGRTGYRERFHNGEVTANEARRYMVLPPVMGVMGLFGLVVATSGLFGDGATLVAVTGAVAGIGIGYMAGSAYGLDRDL